MKKIILLTIATAFLVASCDIERLPYSTIELSQSFKTVKDAQSYSNGLYANFRNNQYGLYMFSTDVQADMLNATLDYGNRNGNPHRWTTFLADDYTIRDVWAGYYNTITKANVVLDNIDKIVTTVATEQADLAKYKSEAYFIRAYTYLQLTNRWAKDYEPASAASDLAVPLVLTYDISLQLPRATVKAVYDQILSDITNAKVGLTAVAGAANSKRITKDAVSALEARVYLNMHDYPKAVAAADAVIANTAYDLAATSVDLKKVWVDDGGKEAILQLNAVKQTEMPNTNSIYLGFNATSLKYTPDFVPTQGALDLFEATDLRKAIYFEGKAVLVQGANYANFMCVNKYPGNPALFTAATTNYAHAPKVIRLAEMYLISAEANAYIAGAEAASLTKLNALRTKRGLTALSGLTGVALMTEIRNERTRELMFEGFRLDDLKRWKLPMTRTTAQNQALILKGVDYEVKTMPTGSDKFVWGLPTQDMLINKALEGKQNPGW